ncbi:anthocyanidin 3-O-glucosyltransferase UFGT-like [Impatiens glandulifera]|uniref:anthocyanidin 3-O-glucosyltransferase UFGT-like n=1 Tax=Impatiens glandulifera TaxID=253017 RepID=UPI001FB1969B|nr:anthocyanidin 3-O-glucosyltransferase UFGT-like [Impatiens glandulifera]
MDPAFHVAALAFPFGTHAAPLLSLVRRLAEAAPNVTFSFLSTATSNATIFSGSKSEPNNRIKPFDVSDGVPKDYVFSGFRQEGINLFLSAASTSFSEAITAAEKETGIKVSCLITDAFLWFSADLAAEIGVPWVPYWTAAACALSTHFRTDLIRERIGKEVGNVEEPLKFIPGMSKVKIDDLQEGILSGDLTSPFAELLRKMGLKLPKAAAVVVNSFEELEPDVTLDLKSNLKKFLCVGPANLIQPIANLSDESGCLQWLDGFGPESVSYVAFGSVAMLSPEEILALAEALEETQFPFLWSIKDEAKRLLPNGFLERTKGKGKLVAWAPQVQVLNHASVGAFLTHCGWNSISEGIVGGVPLICRPFFGDQNLNSRMVESVWEIGLKIPTGKITKGGAVAALKRVLSSEDGVQMRENARRLREEAIKAVEPDGSSIANFKSLVEIITNNDN